MLKLVGGYHTIDEIYRLYFDDVRNEFIDSYNHKFHCFTLKTLLIRLNLGKECNSKNTKFLIRQDNQEWFCEHEIEYDNGTELFIISYGQTPIEALHKCIELISV